MVLLDVLIREGARGHRIFERLFQTSSFDRVLSFLDEQTRPWEELGLLTPLPGAPSCERPPRRRPPWPRRVSRWS